MRHPQLVIREGDGWIARQLRPLAAESKWLVREPRTTADALTHAADGRSTVLVVQFDPAADARPDALALIADARRLRPDAAAVAVCDVKLSEADRAAWTAALFDLGARAVLFPPLSRPVLEDVASGLMAAAVRRTGGGAADGPPALTDVDVIDLAEEGFDG